MSIYKENLESRISGTISRLQITKESEGFWDLSQRQRTKIASDN